MTDPNTATPMAAQLPTHLGEMDKLKLQLAKERAGRITSDLTMLQTAMRAAQSASATIEAENKVLFERLKQEYQLAPADEIGEDGSIKRSPVRAIKEG
jgi:hypothetical protein